MITREYLQELLDELQKQKDECCEWIERLEASEKGYNEAHKRVLVNPHTYHKEEYIKKFVALNVKSATILDLIIKIDLDRYKKSKE